MKEMKLGLAFGCAVCAVGTAVAGIEFTAERHLPGFDGRLCKIQPAVESDGGKVALMTYQKLLLTGSDVFYGQFIRRSADGGRTWTEPREIEVLRDTREHGLRVAHVANPRYNRKFGKWFALGVAETFKDDKAPFQEFVDGRPYAWPLYATVDAERGDYTSCTNLAFPLPYEFAMPFGQWVELEDGDMLTPFYYRPVGAGKRGRVIVIRYRFEGDGLKPVATGEPVVCDSLKRGFGEPSLVRFNGRFYMTLRSDEYGAYVESADGLRFGAPVKWAWGDGKPIGNANTQQHWVPVGDELYLAYTRVTPTNGHVFRNRAPIFVAKFDPAGRCLVRSTETAVVPERGARLGNFTVTDNPAGETWLVTAEWMQPKGCERHGSDNSLWFVRFRPAEREKRAMMTGSEREHN